jgi:hypothetical protein
MTIKTVPTFTATIYVGTKDMDTETIREVELGRAKIKEYVDKVGLCATLTETEFIYTNGGEPGFIVGLINYLRFPSSPEQIEAHAFAIAEILLKEYKQFKVSVVMPTKTVMLSATDAK